MGKKHKLKLYLKSITDPKLICCNNCQEILGLACLHCNTFPH